MPPYPDLAGRTVTLVAVDHDGTPIGELPPFEVDLPWWPEVRGVVAGARERFGVEVTVLRLLDTQTYPPRGGRGRYLVEVAELPAAYRHDMDLSIEDDPCRARYARPGGPAATLRWAATGFP